MERYHEEKGVSCVDIDGFVKDEIMEKISRSGLSSLTEEEREILRRASRR